VGPDGKGERERVKAGRERKALLYQIAATAKIKIAFLLQK